MIPKRGAHAKQDCGQIFGGWLGDVGRPNPLPIAIAADDDGIWWMRLDKERRAADMAIPLYVGGVSLITASSNSFPPTLHMQPT